MHFDDIPLEGCVIVSDEPATYAKTVYVERRANITPYVDVIFLDSGDVERLLPEDLASWQPADLYHTVRSVMGWDYEDPQHVHRVTNWLLRNRPREGTRGTDYSYTTIKDAADYLLFGDRSALLRL